MAMKKKPEGSGISEVEGISSSSNHTVHGYHKNAMRELIRKALVKHPRALDNKCVINPKVRAKKPKKTKAKKRKDLESCKKVAVKPVLPTVVNDEERYCMWWSFHTNFVRGEYPTFKGIKVHPLDSSSRDKKKAQSNQLRSLDSKTSIRNKQAVGITPSRHKNLPALIGSAPHPSNKSSFDEIVANNKSYERDLIDRYVAAASIQRVLPWLSHAYNTDHILSTTLPSEVAQIKRTSDVNIDSMITNLEKHIKESTSTEPVVMARDAVPWDTGDVKRINVELAATAEVFDLPPEEVLPSDTNLEGAPVVRRSLDQEQCSTPHERLYLGFNEEWDDEDVAYCMALSRMKECSTYEYNVPTGTYELSKGEYREEAARYMRYLAAHQSSFSQRVLTETIRREADEAYPKQLGETVPLLYHGSEYIYDKYIAFHLNKPARAKAIKSGLLSTITAGEWYQYTLIMLNPTMVIDTEEVHKEAEALSIIEAAMNRRTLAANDETITVSEDSPTPEVEGAEVVDLLGIREKRIGDIKGLIPSLSSLLEGLTEEEELKVRDYIEMLEKARG